MTGSGIYGMGGRRASPDGMPRSAKGRKHIDDLRSGAGHLAEQAGALRSLLGGRMRLSCLRWGVRRRRTGLLLGRGGGSSRCHGRARRGWAAGGSVARHFEVVFWVFLLSECEDVRRRKTKNQRRCWVLRLGMKDGQNGKGKLGFSHQTEEAAKMFQWPIGS